MEFRNQAGVSPGAVAAVAWSCVMSRFVLGALALIGAGWTMSARAADLNYGAPTPATSGSIPIAGPVPILVAIGYAWGSVANNRQSRPESWAAFRPATIGSSGSLWCSVSKATSRRPGPIAAWIFQPWFGTVRQPRRLRVQQHPVLRHGRSRLRRTARHHLRRVGIPYQCGLDARRRRRDGLRPELERQGRIPLCRSRQQQLRHYRRVKRLPVRLDPGRRELSVLRTKNCLISPPGGSKSPGFFCLQAGARAPQASTLWAAMPCPAQSPRNSVRVQRERRFTMKSPG